MFKELDRQLVRASISTEGGDVLLGEYNGQPYYGVREENDVPFTYVGDDKVHNGQRSTLGFYYLNRQLYAGKTPKISGTEIDQKEKNYSLSSNEILARLSKHPNISEPAIYALPLEGDRLYYVREYIGPSWYEWVHNGASFEDFAQTTDQITSALEYAHNNKIVYGNSSGTNIIIGKDEKNNPNAQLTDWGFFDTIWGSNRTEVPRSMHTPPEYLLNGPNHPATVEAEIYNVSSALLMMLSKYRLQYQGNKDYRQFRGEIVQRHQEGINAIDALSRKTEEGGWGIDSRVITWPLGDILRKGLQVNPADRYHSMTAYRKDLNEVFEDIILQNNAMSLKPVESKKNR